MSVDSNRIKRPPNARTRMLVIDGSARALILVRGPLLKAAVQAGHEVIACAAYDNAMHDIQIDNVDHLYQEEGIRFFKWHMRRQGTNPIHDLAAMLELFLLMRRFKPHLVVNYSTKSILLGSLMAKILRVPMTCSVVTGIGYLFSTEHGKGKWWRPLGRRFLVYVLRNNIRIFFQNPDDRDLFLNCGIVREIEKAVLVNGSGVDLQYFAERPFPVGSIKFLMIARMQYDKGIAEYVEAARIIKEHYPEVKIQLLGPFDRHPLGIPRSVVNMWKYEGAIEYLGGTSDVRPILADCHVFVLPSYREGTPRAVLEAMAIGRPIITTDVPGCRETVIDGYNGFLVPVKNAVALADGMKKILQKPEMINDMGKHSREIAEKKYDVNKVVEIFMREMRL